MATQKNYICINTTSVRTRYTVISVANDSHAALTPQGVITGSLKTFLHRRQNNIEFGVSTKIRISFKTNKNFIINLKQITKIKIKAIASTKKGAGR